MLHETKLMTFRGVIDPLSSFSYKLYSGLCFYHTIKLCWLLCRCDSNISQSFPKSQRDSGDAAWAQSLISIIFSTRASCYRFKSVCWGRSRARQWVQGAQIFDTVVKHFIQVCETDTLLWRDFSFLVLVITARHKASAAAAHTMWQVWGKE